MLRSAAAVLALVVSLSACASDAPGGEAPARPSVDADPADIQRAQSWCMAGDASRGITQLDSLAAAGSSADVDLLTTRGICYWTRFAADSSQTDADAAYRDLTDAIEVAQTLPPDHGHTPLDALYNHRAFIVQAVRPGDWVATVADLQAARQANPENRTHTLDLGVAYSLAGDTARSVAALRTFLDSTSTSDTRRAVAERMLAELGAETAGR